jgi:guanine deaminase
MESKEYLNLAIELAIDNVKQNIGGPFGAIITKDGEIVGVGTNMVTDLKDPTAHAEVIAIRDACNKLNTHDLTGCVLHSSCEPCPMCASAIYWANIKEVHYATKSDVASYNHFRDVEISNELKLNPEYRKVPFIFDQNVDPNYSAYPFDLWVANDQKENY